MSGNMPFGFGFGSSDDKDSAGGAPGFDMNSLGAAFQRLGEMMQNPGASAGPVNWEMVREVAREQLAKEGDPALSDAEVRGVVDTMRLADLWLDEATTFPATGAIPLAWCRSQWLDSTLPMWKPYIEPIATQMQQMLGGFPQGMSQMSAEDLTAALPEQLRSMFPGGLPDEMAPMLSSMLGPMMGMMKELGSAAFSTQLGQALAGLAKEVVGSGDIGIPLTHDSTCALIPMNVADLGEGIGVDADDVRLYLALRESAHQRLFCHVTWLRPRFVGAIEAYAKGIRFDNSRMTEALEGIDMSNPEALQELLASGLLQPEDSPEQQAALARLETLLALVEGWVDEVVDTAVAGRMPAAIQLRETMRRRRAAGGPAETMFSALVGMDLRPRALREAATLFAAVRAMGSLEERDGLWGHPDLLPDAQDLADPLGFVEAARSMNSEPGESEDVV